MKVIFADVDGVLNEDSTPTRTKNSLVFIDSDKLLRLKRIVDATGAKIVLSSTWRYAPSASEKRNFGMVV